MFGVIIKKNQQGILSPHLEGYINYLLEKKYSTAKIYHGLNYIQHFGKYLSVVGMKNLSKVSSVSLKKFLKYYSNKFTSEYRKPFKSEKHILVIKCHIEQFLIYLHQIGVIKFKSSDKNKNHYVNRVPRFICRIVKEYFDFCSQQRGIKKGTIYSHRTWILRFINFINNKKIKNTQLVKITHIDEFMSKYVSGLGRGSINSMHSALRSFFRYLYMYDYTDTDLSECIFSSKTYTPRLIPKHISWKQIRNILKQVDTITNNGKKLHAILVLFISYGLRPIEISKLKLSDIDWQKKEIFFRDRKSGNDLVLPLKENVAYAIKQYLKIRPDVTCPEVFLTSNAPHKALIPQRIRCIVVKYLETTGVTLPTKGLYIFRHSLAKKLLDKGVSITDIASILGHRCLSSTMNYLRISMKQLREVSDNSYANLL